MVAQLFPAIVTIAFAIAPACASCSLWQKPKPEEPEYVFCHANSECDPPQVCNKELGYWRPPSAPADAGVCIETQVASCPDGYDLTAGYNPREAWNTSFCVAGPRYCHSDAECKPPEKCDKHTETFIPLNAGPGAGVCMMGN